MFFVSKGNLLDFYFILSRLFYKQSQCHLSIYIQTDYVSRIMPFTSSDLVLPNMIKCPVEICLHKKSTRTDWKIMQSRNSERVIEKTMPHIHPHCFSTDFFSKYGGICIILLPSRLLISTRATPCREKKIVRRSRRVSLGSAVSFSTQKKEKG